MNDPELMDRAVKAEAVLSSAAYVEAWETTRAMILRRIEECPLDDTEKAESFRRCLRLLNDVRTNLEVAMKSGRLAEFRLAQEKRAEEDKRKGLIRGFFR